MRWKARASVKVMVVHVACPTPNAASWIFGEVGIDCQISNQMRLEVTSWDTMRPRVGLSAWRAALLVVMVLE